MKKLLTILTLLLFTILILVQAQETTNIDATQEQAEELQQTIDKYSPLDESGKVDFSGYDPFKSKADERIATINNYVGPITRTLWGTELELSWVFIFSLIMWLLLMELILMPIKEILDFNFWGALLFSGVVASLAMQGFGKNLVIYMESLMTQWWIGMVTIALAPIVAILYSQIMKRFGGSIKAAKETEAKRQTGQHRQIIKAESDIIQEGWKK